MIKSKLCICGCGRPIFSNKYSKFCQYKRTDDNYKKPVRLKRVELKKSTKPIPKRSEKRIEDDRVYMIEKDSRSDKANGKSLICYLSGEEILYKSGKHTFDLHHLGNKIETKLLEFDKCVNCKRHYHNILHDWKVEKLLELNWYKYFLAKLKIEHKSMWLKEMRKQLKAGLITITEYNNL